jgi:SAM-dependent methyltransferase
VEVDSEFSDDRLVAVYDTLNSYEAGTQPDFYVQLAEELTAKSILEIGCGTGLIAQEFISRGFDYTGVEPAPKMLQRARERVVGEDARWIEGGVEALTAGGVNGIDMAFMAGHVAQFFLSDESWTAALNTLRSAIRVGGCFAFEARNPGAKAWEQWADATRNVTVDGHAGAIETWTEVQNVSNDIVSYELHYRFIDTNEELVAPSQLRFRSYEEFDRSLTQAGFVIERAFGDWRKSPLSEVSDEFIFVTKRVS